MSYDGGPAFPRITGITEQYHRKDVHATDGMSLRDYFAGQMMSVAGMHYSMAPPSPWSDQDALEMARRTWALADTMLQTRDEDWE